MCARDCMQLKDGTNLEVSKITTRFQKEARESGLHHTVSTEDIILVIQKVFPYIKIEQWQSRSKKGKKQRTYPFHYQYIIVSLYDFTHEV